uniref:Uncharacterized protein n=1 Tax=Siphoviridae sp. ctsMn4 TaxID=2826485 RepID=A0A8S5NK79_9CAUD|nr:MAG TPA: hypothetical protein [Siphoviridae sp. ctsMn4]
MAFSPPTRKTLVSSLMRGFSFIPQYKIPPPYGHMTTGTGTIKGILPAVVTTLPQAGYAYIIAQSALFQKRS